MENWIDSLMGLGLMLIVIGIVLYGASSSSQYKNQLYEQEKNETYQYCKDICIKTNGMYENTTSIFNNNVILRAIDCVTDCQERILK